MWGLTVDPYLNMMCAAHWILVSNQIKKHPKNVLSLPPPDSKVPSKLGTLIKKISGRFPVSSRSCLGTGSVETRDEINRRRPLFIQKREAGDVVPPKVVVEGQDVSIQMKPKIVMLRVSMHCNGCAAKVEKHISKIKAVNAYKVDLESKMVVIIGDNIVSTEVLESVSKVKRAELWG